MMSSSYLVNNLTQKSISDQKRFIAGLMLTPVVRHLNTTVVSICDYDNLYRFNQN